MGERSLHMRKVAGSIPAVPTLEFVTGGVAQFARHKNWRASANALVADGLERKSPREL